jgi:hypothetical protein
MEEPRSCHVWKLRRWVTHGPNTLELIEATMADRNCVLGLRCLPNPAHDGGITAKIALRAVHGLSTGNGTVPEESQSGGHRGASLVTGPPGNKDGDEGAYPKQLEVLAALGLHHGQQPRRCAT